MIRGSRISLIPLELEGLARILGLIYVRALSLYPCKSISAFEFRARIELSPQKMAHESCKMQLLKLQQNNHFLLFLNSLFLLTDSSLEINSVRPLDVL